MSKTHTSTSMLSIRRIILQSTSRSQRQPHHLQHHLIWKRTFANWNRRTTRREAQAFANSSTLDDDDNDDDNDISSDEILDGFNGSNNDDNTHYYTFDGITDETAAADPEAYQYLEDDEYNQLNELYQKSLSEQTKKAKTELSKRTDPTPRTSNTRTLSARATCSSTASKNCPE